MGLCFVPESQLLLEEGNLEFLAAACHLVTPSPVTVTEESEPGYSEEKLCLVLVQVKPSLLVSLGAGGQPEECISQPGSPVAVSHL